jgi:alkylhydroperoxidase family enzyme
MNNPFNPFVKNQPPSDAAAVIEKTRAAFGFMPNLATVMAQSPLSLNGYLDNLETFSKSSFLPAEQQLVLLTASVANDVPYAVAVHSALGQAAGLQAIVIQAIRDHKLIADRRLEALRAFTEHSVRTRGHLGEAELGSFLAAGWSKQQIIEIFFALATKEFVYLVQRLAQAPLDEPLKLCVWERSHPLTSSASSN